MKLIFLFMMMDLLTMFAYPIIFVHGRIRQFLRSDQTIVPANLLAAESVAPVK